MSTMYPHRILNLIPHYFLSSVTQYYVKLNFAYLAGFVFSVVIKFFQLAVSLFFILTYTDIPLFTNYFTLAKAISRQEILYARFMNIQCEV